MGLRGSARSVAVPAATGGRGGYLRGTRKNYVPRTIDPLVAARFRYVEAQIRRNRQEIIPFRPGVNEYTAAVSASNREDINITNEFVTGSLFNNAILGDRYNNKHLLVKWHTESSAVSQLRLIVYRPRKTGTIIGSINTYSGLIDQAAYIVYWDKTYVQNGGACLMADQVSIPLNFQTVVNRAGPVIEMGELRLAVFWRSTAAENNLDLGYRLLVQNK